MSARPSKLRTMQTGHDTSCSEPMHFWVIYTQSRRPRSSKFKQVKHINKQANNKQINTNQTAFSYDPSMSECANALNCGTGPKCVPMGHQLMEHKSPIPLTVYAVWTTRVCPHTRIRDLREPAGSEMINDFRHPSLGWVMYCTCL